MNKKKSPTMSRITLTSVRYDKAVTQDSLNKCRDNRSKLREEIDYLQKDLYAYRRRLERAYRPRIVLASRREPDVKDIGLFKLYPRGVTDPPTWTYGDEKVWGTPAPIDINSNPVVSKTIFSSDGSVRRIFTVKSEV